MTDSAHFDEVNARLDRLGEQLADLSQEQTEQRGSLLTLQLISTQLLEAVRIQQRNAEADRRAFQAEMRDMRNEIQRIWEYLLDQRSNGHNS
jgi:hypothetical protein